jgi:hypothetical protein
MLVGLMFTARHVASSGAFLLLQLAAIVLTLLLLLLSAPALCVTQMTRSPELMAGDSLPAPEAEQQASMQQGNVIPTVVTS